MLIGINESPSTSERLETAPISRRALFAGMAATGLAATDLARGTAADRYRT